MIDMPRIGLRGDDESDKDYCHRMVKQHPTLADAVLERMLYGFNPDGSVAESALALTKGLANDDPTTFAYFANTWRECLSDAGVSP